MTRDEALMWLNDRIGEQASVSITLAVGDYRAPLVTADGELRYWRQGDHAWRHAANPREDLAGLYRVGGANLDLTDLPAWATIEVGPTGDELVIGTEGEDLWHLTIVHATAALPED